MLIETAELLWQEPVEELRLLYAIINFSSSFGQTEAVSLLDSTMYLTMGNNLLITPAQLHTDVNHAQVNMLEPIVDFVRKHQQLQTPASSPQHSSNQLPTQVNPKSLSEYLKCSFYDSDHASYLINVFTSSPLQCIP